MEFDPDYHLTTLFEGAPKSEVQSVPHIALCPTESQAGCHCPGMDSQRQGCGWQSMHGRGDNPSPPLLLLYHCEVWGWFLDTLTTVVPLGVPGSTHPRGASKEASCSLVVVFNAPAKGTEPVCFRDAFLSALLSVT